MSGAPAPVDGEFAEACALVDKLQAECSRLFIMTGGDAATEDDGRVAAFVRAAVGRVGQLAADLHLAQAGTLLGAPGRDVVSMYRAEVAGGQPYE